MNIKVLVAISFLVIALAGCAPKNYYQLFTTKSDSITNTDGKLKYENNEVSIAYDFWHEGGSSAFYIYNKTNNRPGVLCCENYQLPL